MTILAKIVSSSQTFIPYLYLATAIRSCQSKDTIK